MLVKGDKPKSRLTRRRWMFALAFAVCCFLCGLSYVAGGEAFRQGRFHDLREYAQAAARPATRVRAWLDAPQPPVIVIDVKFKHWRTIQQKRDSALDYDSRLISTAADMVPAEIHADDRTIKVKMRLKGHATGHRLGRKWSYRVETRGDDHLWGMRRFSLQHPRERGYEREWLYHRHLRQEGVLSLRYSFAKVIFNGEDLGIFALEEHFSKELLESQNRREGPIIKFNEDMRLELVDRGRGTRIAALDFTGTDISTFQSGKISRSTTLLPQRDAAIQLLRSFCDGTLPASEVFKVPQLARFLAVSELYGTWHSLAYHNLRFYYDPIEARLEPVAYDANSCLEPNVIDLNALEMPWIRHALEDELVAEAFVAQLTRVCDPSYLQRVREDLGDEFAQTVLMLNREWPIDSGALWNAMARRQEAIDAVLGAPFVVRGFTVPATAAESAGEAGDGYEARIFNNLRLPVELLAVQIGENSFPIRSPRNQPVILPPATRGEVGIPYCLPLEAGSLSERRVRIDARILGATRIHRNEMLLHQFEMSRDGPRPRPESIQDILKQHAFLRDDPGGDVVRVVPGDWTVDGDLVLPEGVSITASPGTTLAFDCGSVFLCSGAVSFKGTPDAPIVLRGRNGAWAGMLVLNASPSRLQNVHISDTTAIDRDGWATTGGVTFYQSPVTLENCRFADCLGEDALNVIDTTVVIRNCEFLRCASDAFDGDFVTGSVSATRLIDVGGDGIDVSSSELHVSDVYLAQIGDKAISAGEQSNVTIDSTTVFQAQMGVVSKDSSTVEAADLDICDTTIALAAYVKKRVFGPARIIARGVTMTNVATTALAQSRSRILLNGVACPTQVVDVEALYAAAEEDGGDGP